MIKFIFVSYKSDDHVTRISNLDLWKTYAGSAEFVILRMGEQVENIEPIGDNIIVTTRQNPGYLHAAIQYVRKYNYEDDPFVVIANIDVDFDASEFGKFISWLTVMSSPENACLVAAPRIIDIDGNYQNPFWRERRGRLFWIKQRLLFSSEFLFSTYSLMKSGMKIRKSLSAAPDCEIENVFAVHGCLFAIRISLLLRLPQNFPPLWAEEIMIGCESALHGGHTLLNHKIYFKHLESPSTSRLNFKSKAASILLVQKYLIKKYWPDDSILKRIY